jgi:hypothetical protein
MTTLVHHPPGCEVQERAADTGAVEVVLAR